MTEVRAKKALGQHFLVDLNIARKICDALSGGTPDAPAAVLEVGCGMGVLTQFLLQRSGPPPAISSRWTCAERSPRCRR